MESAEWTELSTDRLLEYIKDFITGVKKQTNGNDIQPSYLVNIYGSLKRVLQEKNHPLTKDCQDKIAPLLKAKLRELKKSGEGSLPYAMDEITPAELSTLFTDRCAGSHNPRALQNAIAVSMLFMGVRGAGELYNLCLGDLTIKKI